MKILNLGSSKSAIGQWHKVVCFSKKSAGSMCC